jgi:hypothetical protein
VSWGRAGGHGARPARAPLDQTLQAAAAPDLERLRAQLSPVTAAAVSSLVPDLHPAAPLHLTHPPDLSAALHRLFQALTVATPYLLILDDMQWADAGFWALADAFAALHSLPLLVVLAYRSAEARGDDDTWRGLRTLDQFAMPLRIQLAGFAAADCAALAAEIGQPLDNAAAEALQQATDGNPLHLVELLLASAAADGRLLHTLLRRRLAALAPDERTALEAAAVLERAFNRDLWQEMAGAALDAALPALSAGRFVEQTEHGYRLQHDLIREQVYTELDPARRRELHIRALALFERRAAAGSCAWHARQAARWYRLAGEQAYAAYVYTAAGHLLDQALECAALGAIAADELLAIRSARLRVLAVTGPLPALRTAIDAVEHLAHELGDDSRRLQALEARVGVESLDATPEQLQATLEAALIWPRVRATAPPPRGFSECTGCICCSPRRRTRIGRWPSLSKPSPWPRRFPTIRPSSPRYARSASASGSLAGATPPTPAPRGPSPWPKCGPSCTPPAPRPCAYSPK